MGYIGDSVSGLVNMAAAAPTDGMRASDKTVFIRRLPYDLTDEALEDTVSQIGPVKSCFTVKDRGMYVCKVTPCHDHYDTDH